MVELPILPGTEVLRGDILTVGGSTRHVDAFVVKVGHADRPVESTDLAVVAAGIVLGGLIGAISLTWRGLPISLSTSGGALLAGLLLGFLRSGPSDLRQHSRAGALADEYARPERVHCHRRHQRGAWIHRGTAAGRPQPVPVGHGRDVDSAHRRGAHRPLCLPVPPRPPVWHLRRRADHDGSARDDPGSRAEQGAGTQVQACR